MGSYILAESALLRARLHSLPTLVASQEPVSANHRFMSVRGIELDEATRRAASALARVEGLQVVDLVPADLAVEQALEFLRGVDPRNLRKNRLREGRGAYQALLVDEDVLRRMGVEGATEFEPPALAELTIGLKRYASTTFGSAIAPGLRAVGEDPVARVMRLGVLHDGVDGVTLRLSRTAVAQAVAWRALAAGSPVRLIALALLWLQPYLVFARGGLQPRDLGFGGSLRPLRSPLRLAQSVLLALRHPLEPEPSDEDLAFYAETVAKGVEGLLEPRRESCPWCGAGDLALLLTVGDLMQRKPGRFRLERCRACGLIFQNPRLTPAGLEFYYRDYYDGVGARMAGWIFDSQAGSYEARARLVARFTTPRTWLDVGAGQGHFCNKAREILPDTRFEALDIGEGIAEAERRGWVDRAHRGQFPALAADLSGQFDVVSMHHYLEHTREPVAELDAVTRVLGPGGYLMVEMPNPQSAIGRWLRRWWLPWFQPQHQHMVPMAALLDALSTRGFEVLETEVGPAHQPVDLTGAAALSIWGLAPNPRLPWMPRTHMRRRAVAHAVTLVASVAPIASGFILDQLLAPAVSRSSFSNAYRVLARKPEVATAEAEVAAAGAEVATAEAS